MAIVTRLVRQKMADEADERRHPERAQWRIKIRQVHEQVWSEITAKWPQITPENFREVDAYRVSRTEELMR
jgi:trans-2-enoyl-CoA reductase